MMPSIDLPVGLLLAAGSGRRFAPTGGANKLLAPLPVPRFQFETVAENSAGAICGALNTVFAVVGLDAGSDELARRLHALGCRILRCPVADEGMGSVLAWAAGQMPSGRPIVVALADMPLIRPATITQVAAALAEHDLVAPSYAGRRGHPVGFGVRYRTQLSVLSGDFGARELLAHGVVHLLEVDDPGVIFDIDQPADLANAGAG